MDVAHGRWRHRRGSRTDMAESIALRANRQQTKRAIERDVMELSGESDGSDDDVDYGAHGTRPGPKRQRQRSLVLQSLKRQTLEPMEWLSAVPSPPELDDDFEPLKDLKGVSDVVG